MAQGSDYISDGAWGGNNPDDFLSFEQPMAELEIKIRKLKENSDCLLYTSDAADE